MYVRGCVAGCDRRRRVIVVAIYDRTRHIARADALYAALTVVQVYLYYRAASR